MCASFQKLLCVGEFFAVPTVSTQFGAVQVATVIYSQQDRVHTIILILSPHPAPLHHVDAHAATVLLSMNKSLLLLLRLERIRTERVMVATSRLEAVVHTTYYPSIRRHLVCNALNSSVGRGPTQSICHG